MPIEDSLLHRIVCGRFAGFVLKCLFGILSDRAFPPKMIEHDGCNRHDADEQDFDAKYRQAVFIEQAQQGVNLPSVFDQALTTIGANHY